MKTILINDEDSQQVLRMSPCEGCAGLGWIDIGDCEDGITENCLECSGDGLVNYE